MVSKLLLLQSFNNLFDTFLKNVVDRFPNDSELTKNVKLMNTLRRSNATLIVKFWYSYIYVQYKNMIDNLDHSFLYVNFLENKNMTDVFAILSNISIMLQKLSMDDISYFMQDLLKISKLSELYHSTV